LKLTEEVCRDGFVTSGDYLLITNPAQSTHDDTMPPSALPESGIPPFSLCYVKGSSRVTTLLCILSLCIDDNINIEQDTHASINILHVV